MRRLLTSDPPSAILALLGVVLLLRLTLALLPGTNTRLDPAGESARAEPIDSFTPLSIEPLSAYAVISDRPLFSPERRPLVAPTVAPAPVAPVMPQVAAPTDLRLSAIVTTGGKQIALIQRGGGSSTERVAIGATLSGWQVIAIERDSVTLEQAGARHTLSLATPGAAPGRPR